MSDPEPGSTSERLTQAFAFAERIHRGQVRKKTRTPVLSHLMAVAALVLENGGDEDEAIAALLHDGPEDCEGQRTLDEIRRRFGDRVADIVLGCTDSLAQPRPPWRQRKQSYLDRLPKAGESVQLVSAADKVHNLRSIALEHRQIGNAIWNRFSAGRDESLWYYHSLLDVFRAAPSRRLEILVVELESALAELEHQIEVHEVPEGRQSRLSAARGGIHSGPEWSR